MGLVLLVGLTACGDGVHSVTYLGQPIVILHAQVVGELPAGELEGSLRAAMKWEVLPAGMLPCLEEANDASSVVRCLTSVGVEAVQATDSVPIEPVFPASFEIPIHSLPDPSLLGGHPDALFGYGILLVYEDGNRNGLLDLVDAQATESADTVLASGFPSEVANASLFVYREGELSVLWKIFDVLGCPPPELGFSLVDVRAKVGGGVTCLVSQPTQGALPVYFEDNGEMRQQICEPQPIASTFPAAPIPEGALVDCRFHDSLEFVPDPTRYCMRVQRYDLIGCDALMGCVDPSWDLTDDPPAWWPCSGEADGGFSIIDAGPELTAASDEMFTLRYDQGQTHIGVLELEVVVQSPSGLEHSFTAGAGLELIEYAHDGWFAPEDVLLIKEPIGEDWFNQNHSDAVIKVVLRKGIGFAGEVLAELTWRP